MKNIDLLLGNEANVELTDIDKICLEQNEQTVCAYNLRSKNRPTDGKKALTSGKLNCVKRTPLSQSHDEKLTLMGKLKSELIKSQKGDGSLKRIFETMNKQASEENMHNYYLENGLLKRKYNGTKWKCDKKEQIHQLVLPDSYRDEVLKLAHEVPLAGHLGINKTYEKVTRHFYWPGVKTSVKKFCNSCTACQKAGKPQTGIPPAPLKPITISGRPFSTLHLAHTIHNHREHQSDSMQR